MPHHENSISLRQILDHAREAVALLAGRTADELGTERVLTLALLQLMQIIGEAAGRVSSQRRAQHPEIPWAQIVALRNRLIHGYDTIDLGILCRIIGGDLPPLIKALEHILSPSP